MRRGSDVLVGRAPEMSTLDRLLETTCSGTANVVFVTGEPGIGKTRVVGELVRRAESRACLVLEGSAAEFEQELPFGVVIDALDAYLASLDARSIERLASDGLQDLADVFPSLRALRSHAMLPATATERFRSYYAVRELLERLAARQPVVLVFDDLHWADGASIELVAHLTRRRPEAPILLAATYRTGQASAALVAAVESAHRAGDADRIQLGPLGPDEAANLLGAADPARRHRLYVQSGGNPFYLLELDRAGASVTTGPGAGQGPLPDVPAAVVSAIAREVAILSPAARALAEAAAVVGDPFELDLAVATAGVDETSALTCLDELLRSDLVRPSPVPRRFHFRHPLVRSAVYESAATGARIAAHARCGAALAAVGAPATSRAHHVEQSARRGDSAACAVLLEAAEATAQRIPSTAARWYLAALRVLPETAAVDQRIELVTKAASALTTAGRLNDARAVLLSGFESTSAGATELRVQLIATCAGVEQQLGLHADARRRLLAALDELTDRASAAGAALMVALASQAFYGMEFGPMKVWAEAAVAAAAPLGDRMLMASAEAVLAMACSFTMDREEAEAHCLVAATLVDAMSDDELATRLDAIGNLVGAELYLDRFEQTAAHAKRGVDVARAVGRNDMFPTLFPCLGSSLWVLGRVAEGVEVLNGAAEAARLTGNEQAVAWSLLNLSLAALMAGDLELALRSGRESVDIVGTAGTDHVSNLAATIYAWVVFESGEPARAVDLMVTAGGGQDLLRMPGGWRATYLEVLTRCFLALDRLDDAERAATQAMAVAEEVQLPRTSSLAHRAVAEVALRRGDLPRAVHHGELSIAAAVANSARIDAALSRIVFGRSLAAAGDTDRAAAELGTAARDLHTCGSTRYRDEAEHELRKLGRQVHRRSAPAKSGAHGLDGLSGRELEVARLVVDRRTNPEIAADLFLSLKTVETHMRNIFRKLGVSSRVEVARVAERAAN